MRPVLGHVGVIADRIHLLRLRRLHHGGRVGVVREHIGALRDQRFRRLALAARVVPRISPDHLDLGFGIDAAHAAGEGIDAHHDLRNREGGDVAGNVRLGHLAGDDAGEIASFVEARVVDADVDIGFVAGRVLEVGLGKLLGDLEGRIHVAERGREDELVAALRQFADHALGVSTLGHTLDVLGHDLAAERLLHLLATGVVLKRPARVADRAHVHEAHLERHVSGNRQSRPRHEPGDEHNERCLQRAACPALEHRRHLPLLELNRHGLTWRDGRKDILPEAATPPDDRACRAMPAH